MAAVAAETKPIDAVPEETCSSKLAASKLGDGLRPYYLQHIHELQLQVRQKTHNLNRLEAQRNELNSRVRMLREELQLLQEPGSYVGEVVNVMGKNKVLVKVHPEGKYVVDIDKNIDITKITPSTRVALQAKLILSYSPHESGSPQHPELFESLGIAQPKGGMSRICSRS